MKDCPKIFTVALKALIASEPTVHFLDNLSALVIILQYTSCLKGFIYYYNISESGKYVVVRCQSAIYFITYNALSVSRVE